MAPRRLKLLVRLLLLAVLLDASTQAGTAKNINPEVSLYRGEKVKKKIQIGRTVESTSKWKEITTRLY